MATDGATQMTQKESRGQTIVVTYIAAVLAISLTVITLYVSTRGLEHLPVRGARFALMGLLCLWLYRGSNLARGICIVLFGVTGVFATETAFHGGPFMANALMVIMGVTYVTFAVVLIASPAVSAFLEHQRESLPQESKFERHASAKSSSCGRTRS